MKNKRKIIQALYHKGNIHSWYLRPHQRELFQLIKDTENDIVVPNIARRFGKTTSVLVYCIEEALKKKQDIRFGTAFQTDVTEFVIPIVESILEKCPDSIRPEYKSSKKEFIFKNGSKLKLIGLDRNPNALRGNAIDILVIDEAAFVTNLKYIYTSIIIPATADRKFKLIFPSTPPDDINSFYVQELIPQARKSGTYIERTLDDNTHLDEHEKNRLIESMGGIHSATVQRELFCKIITDQDKRVTPEFNKNIHVDHLILPESYNALIGIDFGGSQDKHALVLAYYDFEKAATCILASKLLPRNTASSEIIKASHQLEQLVSWKDKPIRVADMPEQLRIDLRASGVDFHTRAPKKKAGSAEAILNAFRIALQKGQVLIDPSNVELINCLEYGVWNNNRTDWQRSDAMGHLDLLAAVLYAHQAIDRSNPAPQLYNTNNLYVSEPPKSHPLTKIFG